MAKFHLNLILIIFCSFVHQLKATLTKSNVECCNNTLIDSSVYLEGYIKSPPDYSEDSLTECVYRFTGKPNERIQLFVDVFDLFYPTESVAQLNKLDCKHTDSLCFKFYTVQESQAMLDSTQQHQSLKSSYNLYDRCECGNITLVPKQIMSTSNYMEMKFKINLKSHSLQRGKKLPNDKKITYSGFLLGFKFIELSSSKMCKFEYSSKQKRSGDFTSPNYPGIYPRNIECHFYFYGTKNEKVFITFHTFDIEGIEQCRPETKSDYVELSNFQNLDRKFRRYCGVNKPTPILSDGNFFRVTFKSNEIFDGKGFYATYQFIGPKV